MSEPSRPAPPSPGLKAALWELYGVPLTDFIAARKRLAAALKPEDPSGAAALAKARKPTGAAFVFNQLARHAAAEWAASLAGAEQLRTAQRMATNPVALRQVTRKRQEWVAALLAVAVVQTSTETVRHQVREALLAAVTDGEALQALGCGVLVEVPRPVSPETFGIVAPAPTLRAVADPRSVERARKVLQQREDGVLRAEQNRQNSAAGVAMLEQRLDAARRELASAEAALAQAVQTRAVAEQALAQLTDAGE